MMKIYLCRNRRDSRVDHASNAKTQLFLEVVEMYFLRETLVVVQFTKSEYFSGISDKTSADPASFRCKAVFVHDGATAPCSIQPASATT